MARREQTKGACKFCGKEMTRGGLARHFQACKAYAESTKTVANKAAKPEHIYHIIVYNKWQKEYWLHLEVNGSATLGELDNYLRAIWLECCGHLSAFSFDWGHEDFSMEEKIHAVFKKDTQLIHQYDFGDTTETFIQVAGQRKGQPLSRHPIFLMARNNAPHFSCIVCNEKAEWLCLDCIYEHDELGYLCDTHEAVHEHDEYGYVPLVNSPRVGACAYCGPAEPPY